MANDPTRDLIAAVRARLITDATLARTGVFLGRPPRTDSGSFVRMTIQSETPVQRLSAVDHWRIAMAVHGGAEEKSGVSAESIALSLRKRSYDLLDGGVDSIRQTAVAALNATLAPLGWALMIPLAASGIPLMPDYIDDVVRVQTGHLYHFRIQAI